MQDQPQELERQGPIEIAIVGDLTDNEPDICEKLLGVPPGGECVLYFDSIGGSAYAAMALTSLIALRGLKATGIVAGECTLRRPLAFCGLPATAGDADERPAVSSHEMAKRRERGLGRGGGMGPALRLAGKRYGLATGRHVRRLVGKKSQEWSQPGKYVTGSELVEAGLAEMIDLRPLDFLDYGEE